MCAFWSPCAALDRKLFDYTNKLLKHLGLSMPESRPTWILISLSWLWDCCDWNHPFPFAFRHWGCNFCWLRAGCQALTSPTKKHGAPAFRDTHTKLTASNGPGFNVSPVDFLLDANWGGIFLRIEWANLNKSIQYAVVKHHFFQKNKHNNHNDDGTATATNNRQTPNIACVCLNNVICCLYPMNPDHSLE